MPNFARFMAINDGNIGKVEQSIYRDYRKQSMKGDALADFRAKKRN
ncbi:MAG: hypothetical protein GY928_18115 [Colwellia sp.]|nr:hypothetical protein [Colwellia sp.]